MCGIAGIVGYGDSAPVVDREELVGIRDAMRLRGPDGEGVWLSESRRVGLAHRRLAIIDLSDAGSQPMSDRSGQLHITFNGEIYNYQELRIGLERKGVRFKSGSDTEVLLHLYLELGKGMLNVIRGMFSFALWDERAQTLFAARDPFGIKPFYYADNGSQIRFASQVKALLRSQRIDQSDEPAGIVGFFLWGAVPEPYTFYRSIRALPAGCSLLITRNRTPIVERYFSVRTELIRGERGGYSAEFSQNGLSTALSDTVRAHMVADVPVAVFLSAGVDSTSIAACASSHARSSLKTITLGFDEFRGGASDETILAGASAVQFGTEHQTRWVQRREFLEELPAILDAMDQPSIDGVNTFLIAKAASSLGTKVALSGVGGDELFGGYPSFRDIPRMVSLIQVFRGVRGIGEFLRRVASPFVRRVTSPKYAGLLEYGGDYCGAYLLRRALFMPWEIEDLVDPDVARQGLEELDTLSALGKTIEGIQSPRARIVALETEWYLRNQLLRDSDWAGMAHSLEIRTPLVDIEFFRNVAPTLNGKSAPSKIDLARAATSPLNKDVISRAKSGFSVPVNVWIARDSEKTYLSKGLRGWARRVVLVPRSRRILALVSDAFGGNGGIALYNRDLLTSVCNYSPKVSVTAIPRLMPRCPETIPSRLRYVTSGLDGKRRYVMAVIGELLQMRSIDVVFCSHINLLPIAAMGALLTGASLVLVIYGIEAWVPPKSVLSRFALSKVDRIVSISRITADRFRLWSGIGTEKFSIIPNAIHLEWYGVGQKPSNLLERYGLESRAVIITVGRLASEERYKGFDEVLEVLPDLACEIPTISYLIIGDGPDRARLEEKARKLGVANRVQFTGFVAENEKADHYRLADAFVMPSRGEGFGFVVLEALACGIPVVASNVDGTREATLEGQMGELVNPLDARELRVAVAKAIRSSNRGVPAKLTHFNYAAFDLRIRHLIDEVLAKRDH